MILHQATYLGVSADIRISIAIDFCCQAHRGCKPIISIDGPDMELIHQFTHVTIATTRL